MNVSLRLLLLATLAVARPAAPPGPGPGLTFADDFSVDSRQDYEVKGAVSWRKGELTLPAGARLARPLGLGHRAELRALVVLPARGDAEVLFRFEGDKVGAALSLGVRAGQVELIHQEKPVQVVALGAVGAGEWQVQAELRHGVLRGKAWARGKPEPGQWQAVRYAGWVWRDLERVAVQSGKGGGMLLHLEVSGVRPDAPRVSAEQRGKLAPAEETLRASAALLRQGKRPEAEKKFREALAGYEKVLGREHPAVLQVLTNAVQWTEAASFDLARELAEQAVARCHRVFRDEHPETAAAYNVRGFVAYHTAKYIKARRDWEHALALRRALFGPHHEATAQTLDNLGALHSAASRLVQACQCQEQALAVYRQALGRHHRDTLVCANNLGATLTSLGRLKEARELLEEALALARKHHARDRLVLGVHNTLAVVYQKGRDHQRSRDLLEEIVPTARKVFGARHPMTAQMVNNLAVALMGLKDNASARPLLEQALADKRAVLPPGHLDIALTAFNLANLLEQLGHPDRARALYAEALATHRRVRGENDRLTLLTKRRYAHVLHRLGELAAARRLYEDILPALEKGPDRLEEAAVVWSLAFILLQQNDDYGRVRRYLERNREVLLKHLGPRHPRTIMEITNEAMALVQLHLCAEAEELLVKVLPDVRKVHGEGHYFTAMTLFNLGMARSELRKEAQARRHYQQALAILDKIRPEWVKKELPFCPPLEHAIAMVYSMLGQLESMERKYDLACKHLQRSLELTVKCYGPGGADVAKQRGNLGLVLVEAGKEEEGLRELEAAVTLAEKSLGADHPYVGTARCNLGMVLLQNGKHDRAWREFLAGAAIGARRARLESAVLAQREHGWLGKELRILSSALLSQAERRSDLSSHQRGQLFTLVLQQKGMSGSALLARREALAVGGDPAAQAMLGQLNQARQLRADLLLQGPGPLPAARHQATLEALRKREDQLERALAEAVHAYARQRQAERAGVEDLARRLPRGAALVEFVRFQYMAHDRELYETLFRKKWPLTAAEKQKGRAWMEARFHPRYAALVLLPGARGAEVKYVSLGKAAEVDAAVRAWRAAVVKGRVDRQAEEELRRRLWAPVARVLPRETERLYLAPDGELALVPFEAIPVSEGRYLIERYAVSYLSSGRDLMGPPASAASGTDLILADPDYDDLPEGEKAPAPATGSAVDALRGSGLGKTTRFARLPGTAREAQAVAKLLRESSRRVVVKTGRQASEEALRQVSRPRLLLLSTHGFFLGDARSRDEEVLWRGLELVAQDRPGLLLPRMEADARLRSGLALAGANRWQQRAARGHSDGLLTAYEVEGLDLWGTDLVVLSACETGLGEVAVGEGVIGLRRAFQLAGARTVLASLWEVPDRDTQLLMTRFFALWLKGQGKAQALRTAQIERIARLRASGDGRRKHAPPLFWAGFVCHGVAE
jgi:CHAT domain-containing protein/tetratricopeptide (TPR) repeat protein